MAGGRRLPQARWQAGSWVVLRPQHAAQQAHREPREALRVPRVEATAAPPRSVRAAPTAAAAAAAVIG